MNTYTKIYLPLKAILMLSKVRIGLAGNIESHEFNLKYHIFAQ